MPVYVFDGLDLVGQLDEGRPQLGRASASSGFSVICFLLPNDGCSRGCLIKICVSRIRSF